MDCCWHSRFNFNEELEKLVTRLNPARVDVDNDSNSKATLIKVDSANKRGSLLAVVQVLADLNLNVRKAYISTDGQWFMDVFYVIDQHGNKISDDNIVERIEQSLREPNGLSSRSLGRLADFQATDMEYTTVELTGRDRPGLISEVFAVLADLKCNVVGAEVWTHNSRMASVVYINNEATGLPINDPDLLANIKRLLLHVLKWDGDEQSANTAVSVGLTHTGRRLHQMMYADRGFQDEEDHHHDDDDDLSGPTASDGSRPIVTVENCAQKGYTVVSLRCIDRPKLLFDTVCTLTDMQYVVNHGTVFAEGPDAHQEYYIRHVDGSMVTSDAERLRITHCLEDAVKRRTSEGIKLELCSEDRVGLLSDITRIFRENALSVNRAEVTTKESKATNVFYVTDLSGCHVQSEMIETIRKEVGLIVLRVNDDDIDTNSNSPPEPSERPSLGCLLGSRSEKLLHNLGLIKSLPGRHFLK